MFLHPDKITIVAEIGQNHNGSVEKAIQQMELAKEADADYVKFQCRTLPDAIPEHQRDVPKDTPWGPMSYLEYRERLEFNEQQYDEINKAARHLNIGWMASVWDEQAVSFLQRYEPPAYKIPSACLTDDRLLVRVAQTGAPVVLSTGMSTMREIRQASDRLHTTWFYGFDNPSLVICQCTSSYPCLSEEINLQVLRKLSDTYTSPWITMGYSGHEMGIYPSIAAAALGARYIERHFTDNRTQWGSDQRMSLTQYQFRELVTAVREVEQALGDGVKQVYDSELEAMHKLRRSHEEAKERVG